MFLLLHKDLLLLFGQYLRDTDIFYLSYVCKRTHAVYNNKLTINDEFLDKLCSYNYLELVDRFYSKDGKLPKNAIEIAIKTDNLQLLIYVQSKTINDSILLNPLIYRDVCMRGAIDCLKYLHQYEMHHRNTCSWDIFCTLQAAKNGHLDCLKYAHENGCPWDRMVICATVIANNIDAFKYLYENGCPNNKILALVRPDKNKAIYEYLQKN
jgi:hypothetical protein